MMAIIDDIAAECDREHARAERYETALFRAGAMSKPPCFACGYNGPGYYNPMTHECAAKHHKLAKGDACSD
jgi:hypothetical protein